MKKLKTPRMAMSQAGLPKPIARLYRAVEAYVNHNGGKLIVVGGIEVQRWPLEDEWKFTVGIRCMGVAPTFKPPAKRNQKNSAMKMNTVHKRNRCKRFKPVASFDPACLASGKIGYIESVRFIDSDALLLLCGDKRQRRRIKRKIRGLP